MIYLLRHGETNWNTEGRLQGHKDSALTQKGLHQAHRNGVHLSSLVNSKFRFISSPLGRCRQTTAAIAKAIEYDPGRIEYDDRVKEISFGRWEGQKITEIELNDADLYQSRRENRWDVPAPGGESYSMVAERLQAWLRDVEGQNLILVSHGCAGRILRGVYSNLQREVIYSLEESHEAVYKLENGAVIRMA